MHHECQDIIARTLSLVLSDSTRERVLEMGDITLANDPSAQRNAAQRRQGNYEKRYHATKTTEIVWYA